MFIALILENNRAFVDMCKLSIEELCYESNIAHFTSEDDAYDYAMINKVDLFILNDRLECGCSGYRLAQRLREKELYRMTFTILITDDNIADNDKKLAAYENIWCYKYLSKSIKEEDMKYALKNVLEYIIIRRERPTIVLYKNNKAFRMNRDDIVWIDIFEKEVTLHGLSGVLFEVSSYKYTLDTLEGMLGSSFLRIKSSTIVSKRYIKNIDFSARVVELEKVPADKAIFKIGSKYINDVRKLWR